MSLNDFFILKLREKEIEYGQSQQRFAWMKACKAIKDCGQELQSPEEAKGLKGIGPKISKFLADQYRLGLEAGMIRQGGPVVANANNTSQATTFVGRPLGSANAPERALGGPAPDTLTAFLLPLGKVFIDKYAWSFRRQGYDNAFILSKLTEDDLNSLGVEMPIGHRRTILARSSELAERPTSLDAALAQQLASGGNNSNFPSQNFPAPAAAIAPVVDDLPPVYSREKSGAEVPIVSEHTLTANAAPQNVARGKRMMRLGGHIKFIAFASSSWTAEVANDEAESPGMATVCLQVRETKPGTLRSCSCTCDYVAIDSWKYCEHIVACLDAFRELRLRGIGRVQYRADPIPVPVPHSPEKKKPQKRKKTDATTTTTTADEPAQKRAKISKTDSGGMSEASLTLSPTKEYIPKPRSGGWALLLTLYSDHVENGGKSIGLTKDDLKVRAAPLCDAPFDETVNTYYTAWSSMKTLKQHGYATSFFKSATMYFKITPLGINVAERCKRVAQDMNIIQQQQQQQKSGDDVDLVDLMEEEVDEIDLQNTPTQTQTPLIDLTADDETIARALQAQFDSELEAPVPAPAPAPQPIQLDLDDSNGANSTNSQLQQHPVRILQERLQPKRLRFARHQYDVIVLLDYRETIVAGARQQQIVASNPFRVTSLMDRLKADFPDIKIENRSLELGDIMWILRPKPEALGGGSATSLEDEIVMDCILERKSIDDLFNSMIDKRYEEQKSRLVRTQISRVLYLIEGKLEDRPNGPGEALAVEKSMSSTEAVDEFFVLRTKDQAETAQSIVEVTKQLERLVRDPRTPDSELPLSAFTYQEFKTAFAKTTNLTVKRLFVEQLMALPSVSALRAQAIVEAFPTPTLLRNAMRDAGNDEQAKRDLIGALKTRTTPPRSLGIQPAAAVFNFFNGKHRSDRIIDYMNGEDD